VRVHRHASPLTDIDSRNTHFRESLPPRIIFVKVRRRELFSWEFIVTAATLMKITLSSGLHRYFHDSFLVSRERSPSRSYSVRVWHFVRAHRHEVISWEFGSFVRAHRHKVISWEYMYFVRAHRHEVILWVCISWELNVIKLFRERLGFRESSPSWSFFMRVSKLIGNIVFHESIPSHKYIHNHKYMFSWEWTRHGNYMIGASQTK
jgi:hypothetical protein